MLAVAPGRVNLIGDHTDYAGGLVCPMAIDLATTVTIERGGDEVVLTSDALGNVARIPLDVDDPAGVSPPWARYVAGVVAALRPTSGGRGTITTTLPVAAGLSSSAALEVAVALALGAPAEPLTLAELCQHAEQTASGVPCGIMDQLASVAGVEGHALVIDCSTLEITPVAIPDGVDIVVVHSGVGRELAGSAYADRRREVEAGVPKRIRHVSSENDRVRAFAAALAAGDLTAAGRLMVESHASLRDEFEVSVPQVDALVESLCSIPGVFGARMTGAGFGGCVVALARAGTPTPGRVVRASGGAVRRS